MFKDLDELTVLLDRIEEIRDVYIDLDMFMHEKGYDIEEELNDFDYYSKKLDNIGDAIYTKVYDEIQD